MTELTEKIRQQMLTTLKEFDSERDAFDTSSIASAPTSSLSRSGRASLSVPANRARGEQGLGGIAGFMAKIVGTGSGKDHAKIARRQAEQLKKTGTSGEKPDDFGLVSEDAKSSATDKAHEAGKRVAHAAEGSGSDETDGSHVLVPRPQ